VLSHNRKRFAVFLISLFIFALPSFAEDAEKQIDEFTEMTDAPAADDAFLILDDSTGGTKHIEIENFKTLAQVASKSANYTCTESDYVIIASGDGTTITLPENSTSGSRFFIKRVDASYAITVSRSGSDTIDGATSKSLATNYAWIEVVSDGANYHIISTGGTVS